MGIGAMVCMHCEHPVEEGDHYCSHCGAPVERSDVPNWRREQAERLVREAMSLNEQGHYEEALLACEGALALEPEMLPALSLKALLHEKRGQIDQAIETYQRVVQLNPLSISERARLEALRRQPRAIVRLQTPATRPLWMEALPAVLAFIGAGVVLVIGLVALLRLSVPSTPPAPQVPSTAESASIPQQTVQQPSPPANTPESSTPAVPPVLVDPSRLALAPTPETNHPPSGAIPPAPANKPPDKADTLTPSKSEASNHQNQPQSDLMPDVEVHESQQQGVYEIYVHKGEPSQQSEAPPRHEPSQTHEQLLELARRHQMAGNYREAIEAYKQALPTAPSQGEVHQQIAICYLRLNDKINARTHFQQAIQAYQLQIQRGQNVDAAREGIRACEQGLKLCE